MSLEWVCPSTARLGQQVVCVLIVKSLSTNRLHDVVIHTRIPAGAQVQGTEPKAEKEGELLVWNLGALEPRQEKRHRYADCATDQGQLGLQCVRDLYRLGHGSAACPGTDVGR